MYIYIAWLYMINLSMLTLGDDAFNTHQVAKESSREGAWGKMPRSKAVKR